MRVSTVSRPGFMRLTCGAHVDTGDIACCRCRCVLLVLKSLPGSSAFPSSIHGIFPKATSPSNVCRMISWVCFQCCHRRPEALVTPPSTSVLASAPPTARRPQEGFRLDGRRCKRGRWTRRPRHRGTKGWVSPAFLPSFRRCHRHWRLRSRDLFPVEFPREVP